jgi:formylglycine-generating enzyme required for sulfatase activity
VPAFSIDGHKLTNCEFLEFVRQGGYRQPSLWTAADWGWIQAQGIQHPHFWLKRGEAWFCRTMFAEVPLPAEWPVYVSHAEASAYARWTGKALPSEAQWHRAAYGGRDGVEPAFPWGETLPEGQRGNFDFQRWDPTPVNAHPGGRSFYGVEDLLGNGWEWTSTLFAPFPGFRPFPFYPGYSANFFDGQHYVMKGGSARTAACMLRRSFRNWFQPCYQYLYAAFRCVSA